MHPSVALRLLYGWVWWRAFRNLQTEKIVASDQFHVLGVTMMSDLSTSTLPTFVRHASIGFVSSDGFDVYSMRSLRQCFSTRLWRYAWTIATPFSLALGIQVYDRQALESYECCYLRHQRHSEVRSQTHQSIAWRTEWVQYKLCATVHRCLQHKAPQYST